MLDQINDALWGPYLLIPLLLLTGLYLTVVLRGLQFHKLGYALWLALIRREERGEKVVGDISHYQALSTALAATVGVGNIAGVATAIHLGGPGALFWMWVTGLVGMATKYAEAFLGVKFRRTDAAGEQSGGPMFYLSGGIGGPLGKGLGVFFAVATAIAAFGIGNMSQANSVARALANPATFNVPHWVTGIVLTLVAGVVLIGGIKSIGRFAAAFVPVMAIGYILAATVVLAIHVHAIPEAIRLIFTDAFGGAEAAVGGFAGATIAQAIRWGVARGIFSNESGLGTGGIAAAAAKTSHPVRQALVSMTQTFIDTLVIVSFTGLVIVTTGAWQLGETGAALTTQAFSRGLPGTWGGIVVALGLACFAFSTLLGWAYYGERAMDYLVGRQAVVPYRMLFVSMIFVGSIAELHAVWTFSDIANGLMALPNLVGLLILSPLVVRETIAFFARPDWRELPPV
jgi:AGCS family alanine or glycine:cation symporter